MVDELRLLSVHAHPDDESSKGAPTVARYHDEGVTAILVCCTGGEQGEILNPAMESDEVRANLPAIRRGELASAAEIIGYDHVELLGYLDSGMAGTPANEDPHCFARADEYEAVGRLVVLLRKYRPQVVLTYGDDQEFYPHPDHLRVHDVTMKACVAASDASAYPDAGSAWSVSKIYYSVFSMKKFRAMNDALVEMGVETPWGEMDWDTLADTDSNITTRVDVSNWMQKRAEALRAHATQIDPASPMWFGLPEELDRSLNREEDWTLAKTTVDTKIPEDDLFAGLR